MTQDTVTPPSTLGRRAARRVGRRPWWRLPSLALLVATIVYAGVVWSSIGGDDVTYRVEGSLLLERSNLQQVLDGETSRTARFGAAQLAGLLTDGRSDLDTRRAEVIDDRLLRLVVVGSDDRSAPEELDLAIEQATDAMPWGLDLVVRDRTSSAVADELGSGATLQLVDARQSLDGFGLPGDLFIGRTVHELLRGPAALQRIFDGMDPGQLTIEQDRWQDAPQWRLAVVALDPDEAELAYDRAVAELQRSAPTLQDQLGYAPDLLADVVELSRSEEPIRVVDELLSVFFLGVGLVFAALLLAMVALTRAVAPTDHPDWRGPGERAPSAVVRTRT